jgi:hypothetical protein
MKCIDNVTSSMVLLKNQGAYTKLISISPEFTNQSHLIAKYLLRVPVDTNEYHRNTSYLYRR